MSWTFTILVGTKLVMRKGEVMKLGTLKEAEAYIVGHLISKINHVVVLACEVPK